MKKICQSVGPINAVARNIEKIRKENEIEIEMFYNALNFADCIILLGEGRSYSALVIGNLKIGDGQKEIKSMVDIGFPGSDIIEAVRVLEKNYDKIVLLVNSGSGEPSTPKLVVKQLSEYIEKTKTEKITINAVVSNLSSSIGRIKGKPYANVVKIRGRKKTSKNTNHTLKYGIMNDVYELATLLFFQKIKEAINGNKGYKSIFPAMNKEVKNIGKITDKFVGSDMYKDIIDRLETRSHITMGGIGPARRVAKMAAIRLQHVKKAIGDDAYTTGAFAPKARAGDILFLISFSGETEPLIGWCEEQQRADGYAFSIVGNGDSTLCNVSTFFKVASNEPTIFYAYAAFILSALPLHLVQRLQNKGRELPDYIMAWYHSKNE